MSEQRREQNRRAYERRVAGLVSIRVDLRPDVAHARLVELGALSAEDDFDADVCLPVGIVRLLNGGE
jgi:hypothetical protein